MTLSKRLACVASFVPPNSFIADVGSDHAQLPLFLCAQGQIRGAMAIENKRGPYQRMAQAVLSSPYQDKIFLSLSDGISVLSPEVDTLVLAGMGGGLIERILKDGEDKLPSIKTMVIDAHSERPHLIAALASLGYEVERESFFFAEGIAYDVMRWKRSDQSVHYDAKQCAFGPLNLQTKNPDFIAYYAAEKAHYESLLGLANLPENTRKDYEEKIKAITEVLYGN